MRVWAVACVVAVLPLPRAGAQPGGLPPVPPAPPLLPVPPPVPPGEPPLAEVPRPTGPAGEYDHGYLYLPEQVPVRRVADLCAPAGRWWVTPALELAWASTQRPPAALRLANGLPGAVVPVAGRDAGRFEAALGLAAGRWFGESNAHGVEAGLFLRDSNATFFAGVPGAVVVFPRGRGRGAPVAVALANPDLFGAFPVTLGTFFATAEVNYRTNLVCAPQYRLDAVLGYRYAFLGDELYLGDLADNGRDDFRLNRAAVTNSFHGAQVGLAGEWRAETGWYAAGALKLALGTTATEVEATGAFFGATANGRTLRALGAGRSTDFAVLPVLNVQVGRQIGAHARVFAGYGFQYLSTAGRLGSALNPSAPGLRLTDFAVHSLGFGGDFRF